MYTAKIISKTLFQACNVSKLINRTIGAHIHNNFRDATTKIHKRNFHLTSKSFKKDYFSVLELQRNASQKEIRDAYIRLSKKFHPDLNRNDPKAAEKFHEMKEAFKILTSKQENDSEDQTSESSSENYKEYDDEQYDIFNDMFSNFSYSDPNLNQRPIKKVDLTITLQEAASGVEKKIDLETLNTCPTCEGARCQKGTKINKCPYCNGSGMEQIHNGPFVMRSVCRKCNGSRVYIRDPCEECGGKGVTSQPTTLNVSIPKGVEDQYEMLLKTGLQEVHVTIKVTTSDNLRREGADIHSDAFISISQSFLGGTIRVKGLHQDMNVKFTPCSSTGTTIRLAQKGMQTLDSHQTGDHYIHLDIKVPKQFTPEQLALIKAYTQLETKVWGSITGFTTTKDGHTPSEKDPLVEQIKRITKQN